MIINLLYCGNEKVFDGMMISLLSIIRHTKHELHVYVMTLDLRDVDNRNIPINSNQTTYLENMIQEVNPKSYIKLIDITQIFKQEMNQSPNLKTSYTPYTLVRLYADTVSIIPDHILYLDTDTVANGNIESLFEFDITEYEMAGVIDYLGKWFIDIHYINAGILYLNMKKIRETGLFKNARKMCAEKKMWFPDQSALNKLVKKKLFLPTKYNEQRRLRKDTIIQHFCKSIRLFPYFHTINIKPWEVEKVRSIYKITAYDDVLDDYCNRKKCEER